MDVTNGNTLSMIDLALADLAETIPVKREGEFTTSEISKATGRSMALVRHDVERMVAIGKWKRRQVAGKVFYSRVD